MSVTGSKQTGQRVGFDQEPLAQRVGVQYIRNMEAGGTELVGGVVALADNPPL
jgi:hypothetical protein